MFQQVVDVVCCLLFDMFGGIFKIDGGEILLCFMGQVYIGFEFEDVVVLMRVDGIQIWVVDFGIVIDGFEDGQMSVSFNGKFVVMLKMLQVGEEDILGIVVDVKQFVEER